MRTMPILFAVLLLSSLRALAADEPTGVTTTGTATVFVTPDKATVSIFVSTTENEIADARSKNEQKAHAVIDAVKATGIAAADIATQRVAVGEHQDEHTHKQDGYTASQSYAVTVKDLTLVDKLVDAIVKSGGGTVPDVSLECSDLPKYRAQARNLAILAAQDKAMALAAALRCTLGKPRTIVEEPRLTGGYGYGGGMSNSNSMEEAPNPIPDTPETLPLGKVEVAATVQVTFELR